MELIFIILPQLTLLIGLCVYAFYQKTHNISHD